MRMLRSAAVIALVGSLGATPSAGQTLPPGLIDYQGVLRDAAGVPLSGTYDMRFAFFDDATLGQEILVDRHTAAEGNPVIVDGGLFAVHLGGGVLVDGAGPRTYSTLADVFRDHGEVWLEVTIGRETLAPRVFIAAAAYALNATHLAGRGAGEYLDTSSVGQVKAGGLSLANGTEAFGIDAFGAGGGGFFHDDSGASATVAQSGFGIVANGGVMGGDFEHAGGNSSMYVAFGGYGLYGRGTGAGAVLYDTDSTGYAYLGYGDVGVDAAGAAMGAIFADRDESGFARLGYGHRGIEGHGTEAGGFFQDSDEHGFAYVGHGALGIEAHGAAAGGLFASGSDTYAYLAQGSTGIVAEGFNRGGEFRSGGNHAYLADGARGVVGSGTTSGGYFESQADGSWAWAASGDYGLAAGGAYMGGSFEDDDSSSMANVAYSTYKIFGTGAVSFVQNHPLEKDRVIVYAAPEGDEVAVYTRGSARLEDGVARVRLGETFRFVANPEVGLTAHLTPRGGYSELYVESVSPEELVVRARGGHVDGPGAFDYVVYGLRIGFEESAIVQEKLFEAFIPSMKDHRDLYDRHPELRRFSALARHASSAGTSGAAAAGLVAAIHEYDRAVDPPVTAGAGRIGPVAPAGTQGSATAGSPSPATEETTSRPTAAGPTAGNAATVATRDRDPREEPFLRMPATSPVESGDVLVLDPDRAGHVRRALAPDDPTVVGIAAGPAADGLVAVATFGITTCRVDTATGAIRPGDLLVSGSTPGLATRSAAPLPGTVIGKALRPLDTGRGEIEVLITLR